MRKLFPALALVAMVALGAAQPAGAAPPFYKQRNLISDDTTLIPAEHPDGLLLNAWGLAASATSPWWIANNGSDSSILFNASTNAIQSLVVAIPDGAPTGLVFNNSGGGFVVSNGAASAPAVFIFSSEAGVISGWNPGVPPPARLDAGAGRRDGSGRDLQGPGHRRHWRRRAALCDELSRRHRRRLRQHVHAACAARRLRRSQPARGLRAVRHPEHQRHAVRHVCAAGRRRGRRRRGTRPRLSSMRTTPTASCFARRIARRAQLAVGTGARAGGLRRVRRRCCWSATSATDASTRTTSARRRAPARRWPWVRCTAPRGRRCRSTGCGRCSSATARGPDRRTRCSSRRGRSTKRTACSDHWSPRPAGPQQVADAGSRWRGGGTSRFAVTPGYVRRRAAPCWRGSAAPARGQLRPPDRQAVHRARCRGRRASACHRAAPATCVRADPGSGTPRGRGSGSRRARG